ncbi:metal ABC transporter ATP-binding protein [uncultured Veillonella sp.]|uniref:metal ABC transporter ATP-binding protein n=1 Tax=uncultured Veillonella sp. TaxID=159268 RepID=UPI002609DE15|nr:metal ABC transporter ATP-binding protein [uncultured Veillonella sp.]
MIEINKVQFFYEQEEVLCNISLQINEGDFTIIVGPNGAGKTTFLRLLSGLLSPTKGEILIDGKTVKAAQQAGLLHLVPQIYNKNAAQFPATCLEIVELGLRMQSLSRDVRRARALDALEQVGMSAFANRRIGDLSGGQQQRVMIAQALARKPKYLLLDEPTSGIDFEASRRIMELLRTLSDKGMTIVMVTHDIEEGCKLCDQTICINRHVCYHGDGPGFMDTHKGPKLFWHIGG